MRHVAILPLLALGACASQQQPPAYQSLASVGTGYGGKSFDPADLIPRGEGTGVPMARDVDAGLIVRPDTLLMDVRITDEAAGAAQALTQAQAAGADLQARLQAAVGTAALVWCGTQVTPFEGSSKTAAPTESFRVTLEGRVEIALAPDLDYWKRSALVGALAALSAGSQRARAAKGGGRGVSLNNMRVVVKSPESYRAKLTELWVQRSRAFATAAQAHQAPLYLLDCTPPGDIRQRQQSLEEIALSLSVSCRLGSPKSPAPAAP